MEYVHLNEKTAFKRNKNIQYYFYQDIIESDTYFFFKLIAEKIPFYYELIFQVIILQFLSINGCGLITNLSIVYQSYVIGLCAIEIDFNEIPNYLHLNILFSHSVKIKIMRCLKLFILARKRELDCLTMKKRAFALCNLTSLFLI